jgi:hypothetical protein
MTVSANIALQLDATMTGASDLGNPKQSVKISELLQFTPGTNTIGKADILFADTRTLAASASESLDLAGVLTNAFGQTITAAEVTAIFLRAAAANTNNVLFGPAASNGFLGPWGAATDRTKVNPGDWHVLTCQTGWAVTATTADLIFAGNSGSGTPVTYDIVILGRTVAA